MDVFLVQKYPFRLLSLSLSIYIFTNDDSNNDIRRLKIFVRAINILNGVDAPRQDSVALTSHLI